MLTQPRVVASVKLVVKTANGFIVLTPKEDTAIKAMVKRHMHELEAEVSNYIAITRKNVDEDEITY